MFKKYKYGDSRRLMVVAFLIFLSSGLYALVTYNIGQMVDFGQAKDLPAMNGLARFMILLGLANLIVDLLSSYAQSGWIEYSMKAMKRHYLDGILDQEVIQLQRERLPKMQSNLTNDFDRYETKFIKNIPELIGMAAAFLVALVLLGTVNPLLMLLPMVMLAYFWSRSKKTSLPIKAEEKKKSQSLETYTAFINETTQGYEVIKQHQLEKSREDRFLQLAAKVQADNYQVDVQTTKVEMKNSILINSILFSLLFGGLLVAVGIGITFGKLVIVFSAFGMVMWPIQRLSLVLAEMRGIEDVVSSINTTLEKAEYSLEVPVNQFESLAFQDNDLGYPDQVILTDVTLDLQAGEKILIIGPSGAGKSTILKTLRQSIHPAAGVVTINGQDILSIRIQDYFSLFATVDQIGFLFSGSLRDNISLYQDFSDEAILSVMSRVGLEGLAPDLTVQNDGGNLSGGQRARVLLARALLLDAQIIVCDEIFASLDSEIARGIERDLLKLDTTAINVSHIYFEENLASYDRIYIVQDETVREAHSIQEVKDRMLEVTA